jgi:hypothetical protein
MLNNAHKLILIKGIHTLIWVFYNFVIFYMLYAAITGRLDSWLMICYGFVLLEGLILLTFRFVCPLTLLARRYSNDQNVNFDIFLPSWLAQHTKRIYTTLVVIIVVITLVQYLK